MGNGIYSDSWDISCSLPLHSISSVLYSQEFSSPLNLITFKLFSSISKWEYLMAPLPFLFCVYHICSKLLKMLVYLSQNFLVLQDPVL